MEALAVPINTWDVTLAVIAAVAFGLFVSHVATRRFRRFVADVQVNAAEKSVSRFSEAVHAGSPVTEAWHSLISATAGRLEQLDVRLVSSGTEPRPVIARQRSGPDGYRSDSSTVVVPHGGAIVGLGDPRITQELLVTPRNGFGAVEVPREVLLAFADQVSLMARIGLLPEV